MINYSQDDTEVLGKGYNEVAYYSGLYLFLIGAEGLNVVIYKIGQRFKNKQRHREQCNQQESQEW